MNTIEVTTTTTAEIGSKNIKERLSEVRTILHNDEESTIRINRALDKLEEIAEDTNIQSYTRTQIWNLASMLEML